MLTGTLEPGQIEEGGKAEQTDLATLKPELDRLRELLEDDDSEAT